MGIVGLPTGRDFQRQRSRNPLRVEEGIGLDVHQGGTPREHAAQNHHGQASGVMCPMRFHLALLKQRELFAQEEVLGSQCAARPENEHEETDEIARD
jgi:hypothetical protein